jgi:hypothetical protein
VTVPVLMIDGEVVAVELVLAQLWVAAKRDRLDAVVAGGEVERGPAGPVGGVGEDLQAVLTGNGSTPVGPSRRCAG